MCKEFGQLPYPGGMLDQPFKLYLVLEIIQTAYYEKDRKEEEKRARKR
jgi:hypothetical protein